VSKFAIIAEGQSDQAVLENIILGYFQKDGEEPVINHVQPPPPTPDCPGPPAGWVQVFSSLQRGRHQEALQFNDYLVIHIDADVQEEVGFEVPRRENGKELPVAERVERIVARLLREIDSGFYNTNARRILFAVAVDSIECWLLPLLHNDKKAEKITGCLRSANHALRKAGRKGLASGDTKFPIAYDEASHEYRKHTTLRKHCDRNPSFRVFIKRLDRLQTKEAVVETT
jgi:hypothetical protein